MELMVAGARPCSKRAVFHSAAVWVDGLAAEPAGELLEIAEIFFDGGRAMFFIDELTAIAVDHMRLQIMA